MSCCVLPQELFELLKICNLDRTKMLGFSSLIADVFHLHVSLKEKVCFLVEVKVVGVDGPWHDVLNVFTHHSRGMSSGPSECAGPGRVFCNCWTSDLGYEPLGSLEFCSACGSGLAILAPFYCSLASLQWWSQGSELLGGKLCKQAGHCTVTRTHTSWTVLNYLLL